MCGIFGIVCQTPVSRDALVRMGKVLRHRGPDEEGFHVDNPWGLGMERLAIVDIAHGHQPYYSSDRKLVAVCNGEIYNYQKILQEHAEANWQLHSASDGEVIIPLYQQYGLEFVHHLDGMFAIALLDTSKRLLILVRDRLGKKPLYYHASQGNFYFASEIKAIFSALGKVLPFDAVAVDQYFTFGYPLLPRTLYKGVNEVRPGSMCLVAVDGTCQEKRYWTLPFIPAEQKRDPGAAPAQESLYHFLQQATQARLIGEAPLGCYLSGGIDSSVISALVQRTSPQPLTLFCLAFPGQSFDDGPYADSVAEHLHAPYCKLQADVALADLYPKALWFCERPMRFSVPLLFMLLAQKVHEQNIKVILSGEGADELWAGYECFRWGLSGPNSASTTPLHAWHPDAKNFSNPLAYMDGSDAFTQELGFMPARLYEWQLLASYKEEFYGFDLKRTLLREKSWQEIAGLLDRNLLATLSPLDKQLYVEMQTRLPLEILFTGDRMSMAHGVEVRMPFLSTDVLRFAAALPDSYKLQGDRDKYLVRQTFASLLPPDIANRPKKPFFGHMRAWFFTSPLHPWVEEALSVKALQRLHLFNPEVVRLYLHALQSGQLPPQVAFAYEATLMGVLGLQMLPGVMRDALSEP